MYLNDLNAVLDARGARRRTPCSRSYSHAPLDSHCRGKDRSLTGVNRRRRPAPWAVRVPIRWFAGLRPRSCWVRSVVRRPVAPPPVWGPSSRVLPGVRGGGRGEGAGAAARRPPVVGRRRSSHDHRRLSLRSRRGRSKLVAGQAVGHRGQSMSASSRSAQTTQSCSPGLAGPVPVRSSPHNDRSGSQQYTWVTSSLGGAEDAVQDTGADAADRIRARALPVRLIQPTSAQSRFAMAEQPSAANSLDTAAQEGSVTQRAPRDRRLEKARHLEG